VRRRFANARGWTPFLWLVACLLAVLIASGLALRAV